MHWQITSFQLKLGKSDLAMPLEIRYLGAEMQRDVVLLHALHPGPMPPLTTRVFYTVISGAALDLDDDVIPYAVASFFNQGRMWFVIEIVPRHDQVKKEKK